ncbi:hypothetical protein, partial [Pseudomonas aeruginosa]|uniref:hypothetical protein n=1 Tax=Pseudomonas aeruginosa TaxID=287 RepID=UPI002575A79C
HENSKKILECRARRRRFINKRNYRKLDYGKCLNCNRLGHRIADCPLLQRKNSKQLKIDNNPNIMP